MKNIHLMYLFVALSLFAFGCGGGNQDTAQNTEEGTGMQANNNAPGTTGDTGETGTTAPGTTGGTGDSDQTETGTGTTGDTAGTGTDTETGTGTGTGTSGDTAGGTGTGTDSAGGTDTGMANQGGTASDAQLTATIQRRLKEEKISGAENVQIQANGGVVTLEGNISSQQEAQRIVQMVEAMPNVTRVENNLKVGEGDAEQQ